MCLLIKCTYIVATMPFQGSQNPTGLSTSNGSLNTNKYLINVLIKVVWACKAVLQYLDFIYYASVLNWHIRSNQLLFVSAIFLIPGSYSQRVKVKDFFSLVAKLRASVQLAIRFLILSVRMSYLHSVFYSHGCVKLTRRISSSSSFNIISPSCLLR